MLPEFLPKKLSFRSNALLLEGKENMKKLIKILLVTIPTVLILGIAAFATLNYFGNLEPAFKNGYTTASMEVTSPAFENGTTIPKIYTAQGDAINPPLDIQGVPEETQSLVVIVDDPMPMMSWNHWVMWNIAPNASISQDYAVGVQGRNGWGRNEYGAPDPLGGAHAYYFKVYALDTMLNLDSSATKGQVLRAMDNHVLARAELFGTYAK
jgi:Raf kinase inhibitor-like YbhB/YbcL family protein